MKEKESYQTRTIANFICKFNWVIIYVECLSGCFWMKLTFETIFHSVDSFSNVIDFIQSNILLEQRPYLKGIPAGLVVYDYNL